MEIHLVLEISFGVSCDIWSSLPPLFTFLDKSWVAGCYGIAEGKQYGDLFYYKYPDEYCPSLYIED